MIIKNWTGLVLVLSLIVLVSVASGQNARGNQTLGPPTLKAPPALRQPRQELSGLPVAAWAIISSVLGHDDPRYQVGTAHGALCAENPGQALGLDFTQNGMQVRTGDGRQWRMTLRGYGYGDRLEQVREAAPEGRGNRVEYRRGSLVEWYVNGPAGLEQGFTLTAPPGNDTARARQADAGDASALPLTIALRLGGDLTAVAESAGSGQLGARVEGLTLRDNSGHAVLRYTGLNAHDADGRELVAWLELDRQEVRLRVEDSRARYPVVVDPFVLVATLTASDGTPGNENFFGDSVSASSDGSTIAVGAIAADIDANVGPPLGAVYVFAKPPDGWSSSTETAKLTASDGTLGNRFGNSVGVSSDGSAIAVGAPFEVNGGASGDQGAAYVFVKPAGGWSSSTETAKLTPSDGAKGFGLGMSVSLSGDGTTIASGEFLGNLLGNSVYVFVKPTGGWTSTTQTAELTVSGITFGSSVALSNDGGILAVGADGQQVGEQGPDSVQGLVYVFVRGGRHIRCLSGPCWTQAAKLTASDGAKGDALGQSVGISSDGSIIAAGAPNATNYGAAYIFIEPTPSWTTTTQTAKLTSSDAVDNLFGYSIGVSSDGGTVVVGTNSEFGPQGNNGVGSAYVFVSGGTGRIRCLRGRCWTQTERLTLASGVEIQATFGNSVAISGDGGTIVAGASGNLESEPGAAYVFGPFVSINPFPPLSGLQ